MEAAACGDLRKQGQVQVPRRLGPGTTIDSVQSARETHSVLDGQSDSSRTVSPQRA